jgi:hypothetical protein
MTSSRELCIYPHVHQWLKGKIEDIVYYYSHIIMFKLCRKFWNYDLKELTYTSILNLWHGIRQQKRHTCDIFKTQADKRVPTFPVIIQ